MGKTRDQRAWGWSAIFLTIWPTCPVFHKWRSVENEVDEEGTRVWEQRTACGVLLQRMERPATAPSAKVTFAHRDTVISVYHALLFGRPCARCLAVVGLTHRELLDAFPPRV